MDDRFIQSLGFRAIIRSVVQCPEIRDVFESCCPRGEEPAEVAIFSWKRSGVEYSSEWMYFHRLVSLCLTSNPVMDAVLRSNPHGYYFSFEAFEDILQSCRWAHKQ